MRRYPVLALIIAGLLLSGCFGVATTPISSLAVVGTDQTVTREINIADFTAVKAGSAFNVEISRGDDFGVLISGDSHTVDRVRVTKVGPTLDLSLDPEFRIGPNLGHSALHARITMPELKAVRLSGAARGSIAGFESGSDVEVNLSGASSLSGTIDADTLRLDVSGASSARLEGRTGTLRLSSSGASRLDLSNLMADSASVDLSGASWSRIQVSERLDYALSGGSHFEYEGEPRIGRSHTSGGSSVVGQ